MTDVTPVDRTPPDGLELPKVERVLVASGKQHDVECAVRTDLSSPVSTFLSDLREGSLDDDAPAGLEDADEQVSFYYWFLAAAQHLAETGELPDRVGYNALRSGVWEIKRWNVRVTFFDTDGSGSQTPKKTEIDILRKRPEWPWFDEYLRLTTAFEKTSQKTPEEQLRLAEAVMREDLAHDTH